MPPELSSLCWFSSVETSACSKAASSLVSPESVDPPPVPVLSLPVPVPVLSPCCCGGFFFLQRYLCLDLTSFEPLGQRHFFVFAPFLQALSLAPSARGAAPLEPTGQATSAARANTSATAARPFMRATLTGGRGYR